MDISSFKASELFEVIIEWNIKVWVKLFTKLALAFIFVVFVYKFSFQFGSFEIAIVAIGAIMKDYMHNLAEKWVKSAIDESTVIIIS